EIIKELEERFVGCYTPSAGTVYPTLQLLEDQGYVRAVDEEGKRVYHITPEGEQFLESNKGVLDDILDRVPDPGRGFAGGRLGGRRDGRAALRLLRPGPRPLSARLAARPRSSVGRPGHRDPPARHRRDPRGMGTN